jgi:endonuclease/exonuclease/phosphatase family metal-dependent hydrolase
VKTRARPFPVPLFPGLLLALLLASASACAKPPASAEGAATIRIGSYNVAVLGETKSARQGTMSVMARIASGFDALALEEVGSNGGTASDSTCAKVLDEFVARVDAAAGDRLFAYVRGGQYAILYRKDKLEVGYSGIYAGSRPFTYPPLVARLRVLGRSLDFALIVVHTRPSLAAVEVPALAGLMDEIAAELGEPKVACVGDFNADGSYYAEGPGPGLAGFPASRFATVVPNDADTTVAEASLAYDRIELSSSLASGYAGRWGVLKPGLVYDLSACEGPGTETGTERALSDHYPVWAELSAGPTFNTK